MRTLRPRTRPGACPVVVREHPFTPGRRPLRLLRNLAWTLPALTTGAFAQDASIPLPNLGAGYAQMINVTLSDDLTTAGYRLDASEGYSPPELRVTRVPWRFASTEAGTGTIDWELLTGYLDMSTAFTVAVPGLGDGRIDMDWVGYGLTLGARYRWPISDTLSVEPLLRFGIEHLENDATYSGSAELLAPYVDGSLLNWQTEAWILTPGLALTSQHHWGKTYTHLSAHVVHSLVGSFNESDDAVSFREGVNNFSLKGELERASPWTIEGQRIFWLGLGGYTRFFGENSDALGFNDVFEVGAGLSIPLSTSADTGRRLRFSASVLRGEGVRGWTIGLGLGEI